MTDDPTFSLADQTTVTTDGELQRGIHGWHVGLIALGGIIGSCYFLGSGATVHDIGPAVVLSYLFGGLVIFTVMQSFGELLVNLPRQGSFVSYCKEFLGETFACGAGWAYWMNWVGYVPAEAVACGIVLNELLEKWVKVPVIVTAVVALGVITVVNLFHVTWFGHVESILAILKILAIVLFSVCAVLILTGAIGDHAIGFSVIYDPEVGLAKSLFPGGVLVVFSQMVLILVNFQGSEIVGLAASETQNPEENIPRACRSVAYRIILIYVVPMILLVMIISYNQTSPDRPPFTDALRLYHLDWAGVFFNVIVIVAAFSCANSGIYGTVRALYGLASEGLAPGILLRLNRFGVPQIATIVTIVPTWLFIFLAAYAGESKFYQMILGMAGFTGSVCWGGIIAAQLVLRWRLRNRGYNAKEKLAARALLSPGLPALGLIVIIGALALMAVDKEMLASFFFSVGWTVGPMIVFYILKRLGKTPQGRPLAEGEVSFSDKFPDKLRSLLEPLPASFTEK
jgi:AAT family amino acid transporter